MACNFTFKHYAECIERALTLGYTFYSHVDYWRNQPAPERSILLRHDIDNFVKRSAEFSRIESSLGVPATYFVRIHGDYNIFYVNDFLRLADMGEMGHELGLHSDVAEFASLTGQTDRMEDLFRREITFLETALDKKVYGVATHRDFNSDAPNSMPWVASQDLSRFGLEYDAYDARFVKERKYISEKVNRGIGWWEKCFCEYIGQENHLTVLTHPRWWYHKHFYED